MNDKTHETIRQIKASFRGRMNGIASKSMSEKGVAYKINWGIPLPELKQMAGKIEYDYDLVIELWKENIRECKILATLISASNPLPEEVAEIWIEDVDNQELAEMLAFNTLHLQSYASEIAFRWIATDETYKKICGYAILGRMFTNGSIPDARGINELIDQASVALRDENAGVRHAAYNCLIKFADVDEECGDIVKKSMNNSGIEDFL